MTSEEIASTVASQALTTLVTQISENVQSSILGRLEELVKATHEAQSARIRALEEQLVTVNGFDIMALIQALSNPSKELQTCIDQALADRIDAGSPKIMQELREAVRSEIGDSRVLEETIDERFDDKIRDFDISDEVEKEVKSCMEAMDFEDIINDSIADVLKGKSITMTVDDVN